jgi:serine/threonine-protein kinase
MLAPPRTGDVIAGKYRVERVLGQGGMGVVVAARHLHLGERVAIKFLVPRPGAGSELMARFVREGRAAMRIRSEHVVRVYDIGTLETGGPYLVMEYLKGRDLAETLTAEGPLPAEAAIEYVLQAIEAIAEAHAMGIVHRDLKPSNLFLTRRADGSAVVKVLDFGIAKETGPDRGVPTTEPGGTIGTPAYMAPEQMRSAHVADARTDIWALGATLYALVTGTPPFSAGSMVELHERALGGAPPLRAARPEAPAALEAILLRCMAPDPQARYGGVAELAQALAELAPERARISAERAARILSAGPLEQDTSPGAGDDAASSGRADAGTAQVTGAAVDPSWHDADTAPAGAPAGETTGSRTGASPPVVTPPPPPRGPLWKRASALAGAGMVAALVALAAISSLRAGRPKEPVPASTAAPPTSLASLPAPAPAPASASSAVQAPPVVSSPLPSASGPAPVLTHQVAPARRPTVTPPRARDPLADPD